MRIELQNSDTGPIVARVVGDMTLAGGLEEFGRWTQQLLARFDRPLVVLDLGDVPYIDSSGLGVLMHAIGKIHKAGGRIVLARPSQKVASLLAITNLSKALSLVSTVAEGVALLVGAAPSLDPPNGAGGLGQDED